MRGVGNLTRAAYANQRMTLNSEIAKFHSQAEYDGRATLVINVACFHHYVWLRAFGDALN